MGKNKGTEVETKVETPVPETKEEVAVVKPDVTKGFDTLITFLGSLTDEQKSKVREALGMTPAIVAKAARATANGAKIKRTEKVREGKMPKQLEQLIDTLPTDRTIDIIEWGKLAVAAGMQTQQPPERIAAYYKSRIIAEGYGIAE